MSDGRRRVLVVSDLARYEAARMRHDLTVDLVVSPDPDVLVACEAVPVEAWDLHGLAAGEAVRNALTQAHDLADVFGRELARREGPDSIAEHAARNLVHTFCAVLVARTAANRLIDQGHPGEIILIVGEPRAFLWDDPDPDPAAMNAAVTALCDERGIPTRKIEVQVGPSRPAASSGDVQGGGSQRRPAGPVSVIVQTEGLAEREMASWLQAQTRDDLLHVADQSSADGPARLNARDLHRLPFRTDGEGGAGGRCASLVAETIAALRPEYADVLGNRYLDFLWAAFVRHLAWCRRLCAEGGLLAGALAPRVAVTGYDALGTTRAFQAGLRRNGVRVVSVDHVVVHTPENAARNRGAFADAAVAGRDGGPAHVHRTGAGAHVRAVGSLRPDLSTDRGRAAVPAASRTVLLLTAMNGNRAACWARADGVALRRVWSELAAAADAASSFTFLVKSHPRYDHHRLYDDACASSARMQRVPRESTLGDCLREGALAAVLVDNPSTAAIECIQAGVPVIYLKGAEFAWATSSLEQGGAALVRSVGMCRDLLQRLAEEPHERERLLQQQQEWVRQTFSMDEPPARAFDAWVRELEAEAPRREADAFCRWVIDWILAARATGSAWPETPAYAGPPSKAAAELFDLGRLGTTLLSFYAWDPVPRTASCSRVWLAAWRALPSDLRPGLRTAWGQFRLCLLRDLQRRRAHSPALAA